jgi:hypothetical protein
MPHNLVGPHHRLFSEMTPTPDEATFKIDNTRGA